MPGDSGALALRISAPHQTQTTLNVNSSRLSKSSISFQPPHARSIRQPLIRHGYTEVKFRLTIPARRIINPHITRSTRGINFGVVRIVLGGVAIRTQKRSSGFAANGLSFHKAGEAMAQSNAVLQLELISGARRNRAKVLTAGDGLVGRTFYDGSSDVRVAGPCPSNPSHVILERRADGRRWAAPSGLVRHILGRARRS